MGLGAAEFVTVPDAKAKAGELRAAVHYGRDPLVEQRGKAVPRRSHTFDECLTLYIAAHKGELAKSAEHVRQWDVSVRTYAASLLPLAVARITTDDVLNALRPNWHARPPPLPRPRAGSRTCCPIAGFSWLAIPVTTRLLGAATSTSSCPASRKTEAGSFMRPCALDQTMPPFYAELAARPDTDVAALGLRWLALTATRRNEALNSHLGRDRPGGKAVDLFRPSHTKGEPAGFACRWPARPWRSLGQLAALRPGQEVGACCCQGVLPAGPSQPPSLLDPLRHAASRARRCTDFRSSFRDWCANHGIVDREAEFALAHVEGSATVSRLFPRDDFGRNREAIVAEKWAAFLTGDQP